MQPPAETARRSDSSSPNNPNSNIPQHRQQQRRRKSRSDCRAPTTEYRDRFLDPISQIWPFLGDHAPETDMMTTAMTTTTHQDSNSNDYSNSFNRFCWELNDMNTACNRIGGASAGGGTCTAAAAARSGSRNIIWRNPFPVTLYQILQDSSRYGTDHIISWNHHGRSFQIHDRKAFEVAVMPRYFTSHKFATFARQVSHYRFISSFNNRVHCRGIYYHEYFLRGRPDLVLQISRTSFPSVNDDVVQPAKAPPDCDSLSCAKGRSHHDDGQKLPALKPAGQSDHAGGGGSKKQKPFPADLVIPNFDKFLPCRQLNPQEIFLLSANVDSICEPGHMFASPLSAAATGVPDFGKPGYYNVVVREEDWDRIDFDDFDDFDATMASTTAIRSP